MLDIHVVSHTHWDREWYLTYEQFRFRLVALVDRLLDLLDADPAYKYFHLDGQTIVLEDYLEIRPEQEPRLRKAIEDGRILIGPWYVMPDEFLVSGESLVRNLLRGHRISREFGTPMPVGYLPDLFGHVGQMPQIWRQFGLDNTILWRGFGGANAEYWWDAPDGSRLLMMHLPPEGYCNATRIVFDPDAMMARAKEKVEFERGRTRTGQALLMNGVDHVEPHTAIPALDRAALGDSRAARDRIRRCPTTSPPSGRAVENERPDARDDRRRASQRHRLREPAARRAVRARLPEAAERPRPDAARVVRRAALGVRIAPRSRRTRSRTSQLADRGTGTSALRSRIPPASSATRGRRCCRTTRTTASAAAASTRCTKRT